MPAAALRQLSQVVEQGVQKQRMSVVPKGTALAQAASAAAAERTSKRNMAPAYPIRRGGMKAQPQSSSAGLAWSWR